LPDDHLLGEKWFEWSKERLYKIIRDNQVNPITTGRPLHWSLCHSRVSGVVILSGDVHMAMLLEYPCSRKKVGYPLYELTSSGMTHTIQKHVPRIAEFKDYLYPPTYVLSFNNHQMATLKKICLY
jgi:alkaline phosphatase D